MLLKSLPLPIDLPSLAGQANLILIMCIMLTTYLWLVLIKCNLINCLPVAYAVDYQMDSICSIIILVDSGNNCTRTENFWEFWKLFFFFLLFQSQRELGVKNEFSRIFVNCRFLYIYNPKETAAVYFPFCNRSWGKNST